MLHGTGHELLYGAPAQAAWLASTHCQCACWHRATPHEEGTPDMSCWHLGMWPVLSRLRAQRADRGLIQFRGRACYVCLRSNIGTGQRCRLIPEDGPGRLVTADQSCSIIFLLLCCHCAWHLCGCWSRSLHLVWHAVFMHGVQSTTLCAYSLHFLLLPVVWRAHAPILPGGDAPLCAAC